MTRIKLTTDIPVANEHGMRKGRVFETIDPPEDVEDNIDWWVMGDAGEAVGVWYTEAEETKDDIR